MNTVTVALVLALGTLPSTTPRTEQVANGVTTQFFFNFKTASTSHVKVYSDGSLVPTGYSVALNANQDSAPGGSVTFTVAPANGKVIRIDRTRPISQDSVWTPMSAFKGATLGAALDNMVMIDQQLSRRVDDVVTAQDARDDAQEAALAQGSVGGSSTMVTASGGGPTKSAADWAAVGPVTMSLAPEGTTQTRDAHKRAGDEVSLLDFIPPSFHASIRNRTNTTDLSPYIQAALNTFESATTPHSKIRVPRGQYRIEQTIMLWSHTALVGDQGDRNQQGNPGAEFAWYGGASPAFQTGAWSTATAQQNADNDWSLSRVENIAIRNYTTGTYGFRLRNPQNGARLTNVRIAEFVTTQLLVYEDPTRVSGAGTTPGYYVIDNVFLSGGTEPAIFESGIQPADIRSLKVDPACTGGLQYGVKFRRAPVGNVQGAPITVVGSMIEFGPTCPDVDGFTWDHDIVLTFVGSGVQRNADITSTKAAFRYTFAGGRSLPTWECINCTSWQQGSLYKFDQAALDVAAANRTVFESFTYRRSGGEIPLTFGYSNVTAGLSSANMLVGGTDVSSGFIALRPGTIIGVSGVYSATITTETATLSIVKNGSTFVTSMALTAASNPRAADWSGISASINGAAFHFAAGDRIALKLTTGASFAPTGGNLIGTVWVRYR